jgi:hypothetical protein
LHDGNEENDRRKLHKASTYDQKLWWSTHRVDEKPVFGDRIRIKEELSAN